MSNCDVQFPELVEPSRKDKEDNVTPLVPFFNDTKLTPVVPSFVVIVILIVPVALVLFVGLTKVTFGAVLSIVIVTYSELLKFPTKSVVLIVRLVAPSLNAVVSKVKV